MRLPRRRDFLRLFGRYISLGAGRIGIDGQPDYTFVSDILLQVLHVAAAVMLFHEWALWIKPLEHDVLAFVLRSEWAYRSRPGAKNPARRFLPVAHPRQRLRFRSMM